MPQWLSGRRREGIKQPNPHPPLRINLRCGAPALNGSNVKPRGERVQSGEDLTESPGNSSKLYKGLRPWITLMRTAMIASISKMCT
jgi:uncharacterized protein with gpF-like domain